MQGYGEQLDLISRLLEILFFTIYNFIHWSTYNP